MEDKIKEADVFISTVLIPGAKPPKLVKEYMDKIEWIEVNYNK